MQSTHNCSELEEMWTVYILLHTWKLIFVITYLAKSLVWTLSWTVKFFGGNWQFLRSSSTLNIHYLLQENSGLSKFSYMTIIFQLN